MTSANLSDLQPLLFEHPPGTLARLAGLTEAAVASACAHASAELLLDYATAEAPDAEEPRPPAGPMRPLASALADGGQVVHLAAGVYQGTLRVGVGQVLRVSGDGQAVLVAHGAPCVQVAAGGQLVLEGVRLLHLPRQEQSDAIEVAAGGQVRLVQVRVRTTRGRTAVQCVGDGARLEAEDSQLSGGGVGVLLGGGGQATLSGCALSGQRSAALLLSGASEVVLLGGDITDAAAAVVARRGGRARLQQVIVSGAGRAAFLVEEGATLILQGGTINAVTGVPIRVGWQGILQATGVEVGMQRGGPAVLVLGRGSAMLQRCVVAPAGELPGVLVDSAGTLIDQQSGLGRVVALSGACVEQYGADRLPEVVVDASEYGGGDCRTIAAALQRVDYGGTIRLLPGTYRESIVLGVSVRIEAAGAGVFWESAETCLQVSSAEVQVSGVHFQGVLEKKRSDLVVVQGGRLVLSGCHLSGASQTALKVRGGSLTAQDLQIEAPNEAAVVVDEGGVALIEDGVFQRARLSAVHARKGGQLTLRRCQVVESRQNGLFVYEGGRLLAEDCDLIGSRLAGIEVRQRGEVTLRRCRILRSEQWAAFVHIESTLTLEDCDILVNGRNLKPAVEARSSGHVLGTRCRIRGSHRAIRLAQAGVAHLTDSDLAGNLNLIDIDGKTHSSGELVRCRKGRSLRRHQILLEGHAGPGAVWSGSAPAGLQGAFLPGAVLRALAGADLSDAFLVGADLRDADLRGACLEGAMLTGADLRGADLQGARLEGAVLTGARLEGARLEGADRSGVVM